ncbi:minor structural protein [Sapovirus GVII/Ishi-Im3-1]|uniref:Minor structural protein n=1 Tax=Sapovirus GVII/Ishi-Im1-2 TaxID=1960013 RepID=A0A292FU63_9CALI|nr:minor structural protein [Sapovirus GVII/Ishi-Im1-2]BBA54660.1 minor structural protein [Sapovirus GVII/Ishi-Im3-1]
MSWTAAALTGLGLFSDIAGNIGNIVAQQQMVKNQRKQLELQQQALTQQVRLAERGQDLTAYLSTHGPALQYSSARALGFNHNEARQMLGGVRVSYGGVDVDPRALPSLPFYNLGANSLAKAQTVVSQFSTGTTGFTRPQPQGFSNPNYQVRLIGYRQNLGHNPGETNV